MLLSYFAIYDETAIERADTPLLFSLFSLVWRDSGVSLKGQISRVPAQQCLLYA